MMQPLQLGQVPFMVKSGFEIEIGVGCRRHLVTTLPGVTSATRPIRRPDLRRINYFIVGSSVSKYLEEIGTFS